MMSEKETEGIYRKENIPEAEIRRLKEMKNYPNSVSVELIGPDLKGKIFLDVGAGSQSELGKHIEERGGKYIALDIKQEMLKELKRGLGESGLSFIGILGEATKLPFRNDSVDFVHHRFVLMHLPSEEAQKESIGEALRVAKEKVFLLEHNWSTLDSDHNPELLEKLRTLANKFAAQLGMNLDLGENLEKLAQEVAQNLDITVRHFNRKEDDYTAELIPLVRSAAEIAQKILNDEELAKGFQGLREELEKSPLKFIPPEIVSAVIKKR